MMRRQDLKSLPPFRGEVLPWIGGDLQSLKSVMLHDAPNLASGEMITIPLEDGDALTAALHSPKTPVGVMIVVHGLTGCMDSHHVRQMADAGAKGGYAVLRVNMRGAGPSASLSKRRYSAKSGADLIPFIDTMAARFPGLPVFMVAHSIGGAAALNMLVDHGPDLSALAGLVTVAAPLDLHDASRRFHHWRNWPYRRYMLRRLQAMAAAMPDLAPDQQSAIKQARTIRAFDDIMTAPMMGYATAEAYYTAASTATKLDDPARPLMLIHADNDPLVGVSALNALAPNPKRPVLITRGGGHVGFHDDNGLWLPRVILAWARQIRGD